MKQIEMTFEIHSRENNQESETFLNENRKRLSKQCERVLEILKKGSRLTTFNAPMYGIASLPRRVKDLRDYNGVQIKDKWVLGLDGKRIYKEYYL